MFPLLSPGEEAEACSQRKPSAQAVALSSGWQDAGASQCASAQHCTEPPES